MNSAGGSGPSEEEAQTAVDAALLDLDAATDAYRDALDVLATAQKEQS